MKKRHANLKYPAFHGLLHLSWSQDHFRSIKYIEPPKRKRLCLVHVEQKLIGQGMTLAILVLNYESLDRVYLTMVSSEGDWIVIIKLYAHVWIVYAYIKEKNRTHRSELYEIV